MQQQILALKEKVAGFEARNEDMELYGFKMKKYEKENRALAEQCENIRFNCEKQK